MSAEMDWWAESKWCSQRFIVNVIYSCSSAIYHVVITIMYVGSSCMRANNALNVCVVGSELLTEQQRWKMMPQGI